MQILRCALCGHYFEEGEVRWRCNECSAELCEDCSELMEGHCTTYGCKNAPKPVVEHDANALVIPDFSATQKVWACAVGSVCDAGACLRSFGTKLFHPVAYGKLLVEKLVAGLKGLFWFLIRIPTIIKYIIVWGVIGPILAFFLPPNMQRAVIKKLVQDSKNYNAYGYVSGTLNIIGEYFGFIVLPLAVFDSPAVFILFLFSWLALLIVRIYTADNEEKEKQMIWALPPLWYTIAYIIPKYLINTVPKLILDKGAQRLNDIYGPKVETAKTKQIGGRS